MNNARRKAINEQLTALNAILASFNDIKEAIETLRDEEQESYDAMPESLQSSDRGQTSEAAKDALDEAFNIMDGCDLDEVVSKLEEATA